MQEHTPWVREKWHVSEYNFTPEVRKMFSIASNIIISDCTLRDGEQQPGVVFTPEDKIKVATALNELGIPEIEVGMPSVSRGEQKAIRAISNAGLNAKIRVISMATKEDIDLAIDCGAQVAVVSLPAGYLQIEYKMKLSEEKMIEIASSVTRYAHEKGLYVVFSPMDTTRSHLDFLKRYLKAVVSQGHVDRVRITDTTGASIPLAIQYLVRKIKEYTHLPIEIHCHNDFGLATANILAGLEAGAAIASTAFNGLGERAGNAPTEEVVLALQVLYGIDLGIKLDKFYKTSLLIQELSGIRMQKNKAIVGETALAQEAGAVVAGWLKNPFTAEAYLPELVGQKTEIILGKWSGKASVGWKLSNLGIKVNDRQLTEITSRLKDVAEQTRKTCTEEALLKICDEVLSQGTADR
jgi:isopropylmalate/homocitrate/citramalate synthase